LFLPITLGRQPHIKKVALTTQTGGKLIKALIGRPFEAPAAAGAPKAQ
jgi:hypothetical protein